MLQTAKMVGFLPTKNFEVARAFYQGKLGFALISQDSTTMVLGVGMGMIRVMLTPHGASSQATALGWQVNDIEAVVDRLAGAGREDGKIFLRAGPGTRHSHHTRRQGRLVQGS